VGETIAVDDAYVYWVTNDRIRRAARANSVE
jgi:hypothetical protein